MNLPGATFIRCFPVDKKNIHKVGRCQEKSSTPTKALSYWKTNRGQNLAPEGRSNITNNQKEKEAIFSE